MSALWISNIALWIVVCILSLLVFALMRQIGVLHERVFPAGALMTQQGLTVGEKVPATPVSLFSGSTRTLGTHTTDDSSKGNNDLLLLFVSPQCPVCKTLIPIVESTSQSENKNIEILLVSDGNTEQERQQHERFIEQHHISPQQYAISRELGLLFLVDKLPFAALVDRQGVLRAKGIVNSREHLESLFEAQAKGVASLQEYLSHA